MFETFAELFLVLVLWGFAWMLPAAVLVLVFVHLKRHGPCVLFDCLNDCICHGDCRARGTLLTPAEHAELGSSEIKLKERSTISCILMVEK